MIPRVSMLRRGRKRSERIDGDAIRQIGRERLAVLDKLVKGELDVGGVVISDFPATAVFSDELGGCKGISIASLEDGESVWCVVSPQHRKEVRILAIVYSVPTSAT